VQEEYFLARLPFKQAGRFYFKVKGLNAAPNTVVLFQCLGNIIASAVFRRSERFDKPHRDGHHGWLEFEASMIKVFDQVDWNGMKKIWPTIRRFGNYMQKLDPISFSAFERGLQGVSTPIRLDADDRVRNESMGSCADGSGGIDQRNLVRRLIAQRKGQPPFRNALLTRYENRCVVTECRLVDLLEAAHIRTCPGQDDNNPENGLLLRADIHTLFDLDLLGIHPRSLRVELHPDIAADDDYARFVDIKLHCPANGRPSLISLRERYELFTRRRSMRS
jgi:hypothetical protein